MTTINLFRNARDTREIAAGETIFLEGDTAGTMFAVLEGEVEILYRGQCLETVYVPIQASTSSTSAKPGKQRIVVSTLRAAATPSLPVKR